MDLIKGRYLIHYPTINRSVYRHIPLHHHKAMYVLSSNQRLPKAKTAQQAARIYQQNLRIIEQAEHNLRHRHIKRRLLRVMYCGQEVCFNCLKPFHSKKDIAKHHLLAKRLRLLDFYHPLEPLVQVHRKCTNYYHRHYDPFKHRLTIWSAKRYLQIAQQVGFGFAILCRNLNKLTSSSLEVDRDLIPFILGQANFGTPATISMTPRLVPYLKIANSNLSQRTYLQVMSANFSILHLLGFPYLR